MLGEKGENYQVFLTEDTLRGMLLEVSRHSGKECIVQMPGVRIGKRFYFDMVADSGINAVYEYSMCEKDHVYIDHLSTRISEYYNFPVGQLTVSQVHKHPPKVERFSLGDAPANKKLAQQFGGVVNGLILVDPEFRLKFWYIDEMGYETEAVYFVDEKAVRMVMPKKNLELLKKTVEYRESEIRREKERNFAKLIRNLPKIEPIEEIEEFIGKKKKILSFGKRKTRKARRTKGGCVYGE